jgi:uncharacterized membrane protein YidH (DUF202 family)
MSGPPAWDAAGHREDVEEMDPGLARERTELAWRRTAISFAALGGAVLRAHAVIGGVIIVMGLGVWAIPRLLHRSPTGGGRQPVSGRAHLLVTAMTVLVSLVGLAIVLLEAGQLTP